MNKRLISVAIGLVLGSPQVATAQSAFYVQVNTNALGHDIIGDAGNEPSIAVDPNNPNRMAVGWRQFDTITSNFRQAGVAYTTNGGLTWTSSVLTPGLFRSDPVLRADADGNFYYSSLSSRLPPKSSNPPMAARLGDRRSMRSAATSNGSPSTRRTDQAAGTFIKIGTCNSLRCRMRASPVRPMAAPRSTSGSRAEPLFKWGTMAVGPTGTLYAAGSNLDKPGICLPFPRTRNSPRKRRRSPPHRSIWAA